MFNRREMKYILTDETYLTLRNAIEKHMVLDKYCIDEKGYTIHNIYFDTLNHEVIGHSIEKPIYKEKLRLRSYDTVQLDDKVYLEIKKKYNGIVNKRRISLTLKDAYRFIESKEKPEEKPYINKQILGEIDYHIQQLPLIPAIFLAYDRVAFFSKEDKSFRVTFDKNIRTRRYDIGLEYGDYGDLLLEEGTWIMEAKAERAMPLWFAQLLSKYKVYRSSFSKYGTEYKQNILHKEIKLKVI